MEAAFDAVVRSALRRGEQDDDLYVDMCTPSAKIRRMEHFEAVLTSLSFSPFLSYGNTVRRGTQWRSIGSPWMTIVPVSGTCDFSSKDTY